MMSMSLSSGCLSEPCMWVHVNHDDNFGDINNDDGSDDCHGITWGKYKLLPAWTCHRRQSQPQRSIEGQTQSWQWRWWAVGGKLSKENRKSWILDGSPFVITKNKGGTYNEENSSQSDKHIDNVKRLQWLLTMAMVVIAVKMVDLKYDQINNVNDLLWGRFWTWSLSKLEKLQRSYWHPL